MISVQKAVERLEQIEFDPDEICNHCIMHGNCNFSPCQVIIEVCSIGVPRGSS